MIARGAAFFTRSGGPRPHLRSPIERRLMLTLIIIAAVV